MPVVLFTASTWSHIAHFHRPYLRAFHALGWQVHAACGGASLPIPEADACFDIPFEKKMTAPANFRAQARLRALMAEHRYDLVITHTSLAAFFTRLAAASVRHRPAVVNVAHGYLFDDETPFLKKNVLVSAERLTASQTDLLLTMNDYDTRFARRYRLGRRVEQIPGMGVDFSRFPAVSPQERLALRREHGINADAFVLLYAAEFSPRKSQATLLPGPCRFCLSTWSWPCPARVRFWTSAAAWRKILAWGTGDLSRLLRRHGLLVCPGGLRRFCQLVGGPALQYHGGHARLTPGGRHRCQGSHRSGDARPDGLFVPLRRRSRLCRSH